MINPYEMREWLVSQCDRYLTSPLLEACKRVLLDDRFVNQVGSYDKHHAYPGGLMIHTGEVVRYVLDMAAMFPGVDLEALLTAAIFHDYMKIYDYYADSGKKTPYRSLVRHVSGSHAAFLQLTDLNLLSEKRRHLIEHIILAHHGRPEWGSPVEPQTVEAHILHFADMFSALYGPGKYGTSFVPEAMCDECC